MNKLTVCWKNNQYRAIENPNSDQISEAVYNLDRSKWMMLQLVVPKGSLFILAPSKERYFVLYSNGFTETALLTDPSQEGDEILEFVWDSGHSQEADIKNTVDISLAIKAMVYFLENNNLNPDLHWSGMFTL